MGIGIVVLGSLVVVCAVVTVPSIGTGYWTWAPWIAGTALLFLVAVESLELVDVPFIEMSGPSKALVNDTLFVSIHVAICSEPPELVSRTLRALADLHYPNFEVVVVDNNTADETLWKPIQDLCFELGSKFTFYHLATCPGKKAGALNFALANTSQHARAIAVIDSDYEVSPEFLSDLVPELLEDGVGFVQGPQDYRDWDDCWTGRMMYFEYADFFEVSMRARKSQNAILMHGTMTLIRLEALKVVGGWSEWCLTEDSELGLRLLTAGFKGTYRDRTLGRGLVPLSFSDFARQRGRWVAGGQQTLAKHWRQFLPTQHSLTAPQKLHYLRGWAPWVRDALLLLTAPVVLATSFATAIIGSAQAAPLWGWAVIVLFAHIVMRQGLIYSIWLRRSRIDMLAATLTTLILPPTVGSAWLMASIGKPPQFLRTPKRPQDSGNRHSGRLHAAIGASCVVATLLLAGSGAYITGTAFALIGASFGISAVYLHMPVRPSQATSVASRSAR